ncbi:MAG: type II toxin-antitoxin system ParD family antitoxin [Brucellaceae bacterium]|nr:type II toxin-antitoxin system ParD family antitoxin [Brucellaceae bacterium]
MGTVEKVSVALSAELLQMVKDAVRSGDYASTSEVVRDALRDWQYRQELRKAELDRVRHAWQAGIDSGDPEPFDANKIRKKARARLTEIAGRGRTE